MKTNADIKTMKKYTKTSTLLAVSCIALFGLSGCGQNANTAEQPSNSGRFINEYVQSNGFGSFRTIIKDTKTGKRYLFVKAGYAGGLAEIPGEQ